MLKKFLIFSIVLTGAMNLQALEITRYVKSGATGDGMTAETPSGDLGSMLALSAKVDRLSLMVAPGTYTINVRDTGSGVSYSNVELNGSWGAENTTTDKVRINYPGVGFQNSDLYNVSFSGSVQIDGGTLIECSADKQMGMAVGSGDVQLFSCKAQTFRAENWGHASGRSIFLFDCTSTKGGGYGLYAKDIDVIDAEKCKFSDNNEGGVNIENCKTVYFTDCEFCFNSGDGAVRLVCFDNSASSCFNRCEFIGNDVTNNNQHNIFIYSDVSFYDCLFAANREKGYDRKGFIHLVRPDFMVCNCTFVDNLGALELEGYYPAKYQIANCAFWNNGATVVHSTAGNDVPLLCCAMDHGTGIPELDAQKGIIMLTQANKGFRFNGANIDIEPNSVLINQGAERPIDDFDIHGHPRTVLGGTDIGCTEFLSTPGMWKADTTKICTPKGNYLLYSTKLNETNYYLLANDAITSSGEMHFHEYDWDIIYLDKMPVKPKTHTLDNGNVLFERHFENKNDNSFIANLVSKDANRGRWKSYTSSSYSTAKERPVVKIVDGKARFIKPTPKTTTRKTGTSTRKTTSTKRTTTKRR